MHTYLLPLAEKFTANANVEFGEQMKRYMKNHFEFFGIKQAPRRVLFKAFLAEQGVPTWENTIEIAQELYIQPEREYHYCAIELLMKHKKSWTSDSLDFFVWMITNNSWWDTVDYISADLIGVFFQKFPDHTHEITWDWIQSPNLWLKRTAIIFQRKYKRETDEKLLFRNVEACANEKEFFIAKGIGWALRAHAKTFPDQVIAFVETVPLQALSKREAIKNITI